MDGGQKQMLKNSSEQMISGAVGLSKGSHDTGGAMGGRD